jgi:lysozyme family protein
MTWDTRQPPPSAFDRALAETLGVEGGASSHPKDHAGAGLPPGTVHTYRGITQRTYDAWRRKRNFALRAVTLIEDWEIRALSQDEFWRPCKCDQLPAALALAVFDMAFHSSPRDACRALQRAVGVTRDGDIGPVTLAAVRAGGHDVVRLFLHARAAEIQDILRAHPDQVVFLEGWIVRCIDQAWKRARNV